MKLMGSPREFLRRFCLARARGRAPSPASEAKAPVREDFSCFRKAVENAPWAFLWADAEGRIQWVNPAFCAVTGYGAEEVVGRNPSFLKSGRHGPDFYRDLWAALLKKGWWQGEIWNRRKNGEVYPESLTINAVKNDAGKTLHYLGMFTDISARKLSEERLNLLARHDPLTGLPNRLLFRDRLDQALAQARRYDLRFAVLFLDLDNFKPVNDTLGHAFGDGLLSRVSVRITSCLREADTAARIGGDEFAILLSKANALGAARAARKILKAAARPYDLEGRTFTVTASLGIALYPNDGNDAAELLRRADAAMYRAKARGGNACEFFHERRGQPCPSNCRESSFTKSA